MIGYLCATPFHITAAITMQSGQFAGESATLIILNHFDVDEALLERIRQTGVFDEVLLFDSRYRTKMDNLKRLVNAFIPAPLMRRVANRTAFSHFICFALDFIDLTYIIRRYEKRGVACEFAFGDDGIGTYIRDGIYRPKPLAQKLLRLSGRLGLCDRVTRVYAYKPSYMVANTEYDVRAIEQSEQACERRRAAVSAIWPLEEDVPIDGGILYFEQPNEADRDSADQRVEQKWLRAAADALGVHTCVKMHPRSLAEPQWRPFNVLRTKMPYEVLLLQKRCAPALLMTVNSTALFSTYLFDDLLATECPSVLLYKLMVHRNEALTAATAQLCARINASQEAPRIFDPDTEEQLQQLLDSVK